MTERAPTPTDAHDVVVKRMAARAEGFAALIAEAHAAGVVRGRREAAEQIRDAIAKVLGGES